MKNFFLLLGLCLLVNVDAQTRRIAHRFHSGADYAAYTSGDGSYGGPYIPMKYALKLDTIRLESGKDSVIWVTDSTSLMIDTAQFHHNRIQGKLNSAREYGKICSSYTGT